MIQRVQTLWMILAAFAVFLTIKFSFYSGTLVLDNSFHEVTATDNFLILILTSALGTGITINIFLYKHRSIQMRIILAAIVAECLIIYMYIRQTNKFSAGNFNLWSALHLIIILFLIFAAKGIYNDSKLIKESNRLR
ncbi:MAG TPA: DUF4293 family protein [Hanamia sp.]